MDSAKKKRTWLHITGWIILFLLISGGVYGYSVYHSLTNAVETMYHPIERKISPKRTEEIVLDKKEPFSVLLLGVDEREGDRGRSDSIIVMTVNPILKSVKILSIPRDVRTEIVGHGTVDKINHAYAFGGVKMAIETVEHFLDMPIDYYAQINMEGFEEIVNSVGGVTVFNDLDFTYDGFHFPKGELTLNGEKALSYSRMRYKDPRGDFGRQQRQRQIIQAILKEGSSFPTLTRFYGIFEALGNNIKTNLTFDELVDIQKNYRATAQSITQLNVEGSGTKINDIYYLIVSDENKRLIQRELKKHLELE